MQSKPETGVFQKGVNERAISPEATVDLRCDQYLMPLGRGESYWRFLHIKSNLLAGKSQPLGEAETGGAQ